MSKWRYVVNEDCSKPWFDLDCQLSLDASNVAAEAPLNETNILPLVYSTLDSLPAGFHPFLSVARKLWKRSHNHESVKAAASHLANVVSHDVRRKGPRSAFRMHADHVVLARREEESIEAMLVSEPYRCLGMRIMEPLGRWWIPSDVEHRFLEVRPSTIQGAGLGLFVREGRLLRRGTIVAEYTGATENRCRKGFEGYTVRLTSNKFVCGVDFEGSLRHLAAVANDTGLESNCVLQEFEQLPDRVFFVAKTDLEPGCEIFVQYGAQYWGAVDYQKLDDATTQERPKLGKRLDPDAALITRSYCRLCKSSIEKRAWDLHRRACEDPKCSVVLPFEDLNCLPINSFTLAESSTASDRDRAVYFVGKELFTHLFSHDSAEDDRPTKKTR